MSIPISKVGVATKTLGASGEGCLALNSSSYFTRNSSGNRDVCSRATTLSSPESRYRFW